jgi:hypothetical protein
MTVQYSYTVHIDDSVVYDDDDFDAAQSAKIEEIFIKHKSAGNITNYEKVAIDEDTSQHTITFADSDGFTSWDTDISALGEIQGNPSVTVTKGPRPF